jgi:hypothetical protein
MRIGTYFLVAMLLTPLARPKAQTPSVCLSIIPRDTATTVKVGASAGLISKLLSSLGLTGEYKTEANVRTPTDDESAGVIQALAIVCAWLDGDKTKTTDQKIEVLKGWVISMLTYQHKRSEYLRRGSTLALVEFKVHHTARCSPEQLHVIKTPPSLGDVISTPPPPPPKGAIVLKVFPKRNLSLEDILKLRKLIPNYDIRQGRSGLSGANYSADVLFVNRNTVSEDSVIEVMRALQSLGIEIKSVQQHSRGPNQIQVGTIVPQTNHPAFAKSSPLDVEKLSLLKGDEFWKAAFNGEAWCDTGIGHTTRCTISSDGRPVL